jgi:hypothetical protein
MLNLNDKRSHEINAVPEPELQPFSVRIGQNVYIVLLRLFFPRGSASDISLNALGKPQSIPPL